MKLSIIFLTVTVLSSSAFPVEHFPELSKELQDFVSLLPQKKLAIVFQEYLATDEEVSRLVQFLHSEFYKKFILDIEAVEEYQKLITFIESRGINIYVHARTFHEFMSVPLYRSLSCNLFKTGKGVKGMLEDMETIIPWDSIADLAREKLRNSEPYRNFSEMINSDEFKLLFCDLSANDIFQSIYYYGRSKGLDIYMLYEFYLKILYLKLISCRANSS